MRNLAVFLLLVVLVGFSAAYYMYDDYNEEDGNQMHKRGSNLNDLCIPWRAPCPSDSAMAKKYPFLKCCDGMTCRCTLWGNNCKCESRLGR